MKIVFLNVWHGKLGRQLHAFIQEHSPSTDIFCVQEADPPFQALMSAALPAFAKAAAGKHFKKHWLSWHASTQATYARPSAPIVESQAIMPRGADIGLALYTKHMVNGMPLHIVNVHGFPWPGKLDSPRRLEFSRAILDFLEHKDGIKIVGGDFNLLPAAHSVSMFSERGYANLIADYKIETTRNRFAWEKYPGRELYYSDYVFVKGAAPKSFLVPRMEISDHLPLLLEL